MCNTNRLYELARQIRVIISERRSSGSGCELSGAVSTARRTGHRQNRHIATTGDIYHIVSYLVSIVDTFASLWIHSTPHSHTCHQHPLAN